jgi:hypothetical protein
MSGLLVIATSCVMLVLLRLIARSV